jgi:hypothetical protein
VCSLFTKPSMRAKISDCIPSRLDGRIPLNLLPQRPFIGRQPVLLLGH